MAPNVDTMGSDTTHGIPATLIPQISQFRWEDKSSLALEVQVINGVFTILVVIFFVIRAWTRLAVHPKSFRLDDYLIVGATLSSIGSMVIAFLSIKDGLGTHTWNIPLDRIVPSIISLAKHFRVGAILYCAGLTFAKLSVIVVYLRVLPVEWFRRVLLVVAAVLFINFFLNLFLVLFQCRPMNAGWDFRVQHRSCINLQAFYYYSAGLNIVTDCMMCTLPLPLIWKLGMDTRKKFAVSILFGVGFISCIASVVRVLYIKYIARIDMPYVVAKLMIWSVVEVNLIIICASVPTIKTFFVHAFPRVFDCHNNSRQKEGPEKHELPSVVSSGLTGPSEARIAQVENHRPRPSSGSEHSKATASLQETIIEIPEPVHDVIGRPKRSPTNATETSINMPIQMM